MGHVKISPGNAKLGSIPSVSLPSVLTCAPGPCQHKCYARKLERLRPTVAAAYASNLELLQTDPVTFWREVEGAVMMSRFFRFHVSGDIPDKDYLRHMVEIAQKNQHCQILCFTKKFELVNSYIFENALFGGRYPENLHIIFSAWVGQQMINPYLFPEAHIRYKDGSATTTLPCRECAGNCTQCAITDDGCWVLKPGERVIFNEH